MKNYILFVIAIIFSNSIFGQKNPTITEKISDQNNQLQFAKLSSNKSGVDDKSVISLLNNINANNTNDISYAFKQAQIKDDLGYIHKEYQQYYKGIKIYGATYAVHIKNENIEFINGEYAYLKEFNIIPKLHASEVSKIVFSEAIKKYTSISEKQIEISNLVIAKDLLANNQEYRLGYEVNILATNGELVEIYFIDAQNGKLLNTKSKVCHANTTNAIAQTAYSGTQNYTNGFPISSPNFVTDSYNGAYRLSESRQGVSIITLNNLNHNYSDVGSAIEFTDNDNNWTQAEHGNNKYALDAHWGAEKVFDYWKTVHNRNSIDNAGMIIRNYVHTLFNGDPSNAAWWSNKMFYGDGDGTTFGNLTSLDICAHELGHGICQYTSNLYYSGESGALNEGFSDIWGAIIEA